MYLIILPIIALFLGAEDKATNMEDRIAEFLAEIDEMTIELNEMNRIIETKQKLHDKWENDFRVYSKQLEEMKKDDHQYYSIQYLRDQARSEWIPLRDELRPMISVRDAFQLKLNEVILEWELTQETLAKLLKTIMPTEPKMYIGITISQTCESMIQTNTTSECPTYRELIDVFDNTNELVSGSFIEKDNDLRRDDNQMKNHWQFYPQNGYQTVVMVDPDVLYKRQAVMIEVQSSDFRVANVWADQSKQSSYVNGTIISYNGFSVDRDCTQINSAPNMERITNVIGFAISGCTEQFDIQPNVMKLNSTEFDKTDSQYYKYQEWLSQVIEDLKREGVVSEMVEGLSSKTYPDWFNNNVKWIEEGEISNVEFIDAYKMLVKQGILY